MTATPVSIERVLAELPEDLQAGVPPEVNLAELIARAGAQPVPIGRLSRFWTLGTLQGKIAAGYAFWWVRGMWGNPDQRQRLLNETHLKAAVQLLGTMSHLRGAVMKLGQVLAAWPGVAPEEFADVLGRLHFKAPPMHFSLLREMVRSELGADPEDLFAEFQTEAVAAASLGQVHRARLKTGELVAVKIQYPGIARSIRADVANLKALMLPMRLGADNDSIMAQLDDVEQMLTLETDYVAEAENLRTARRTLEGLEGVVVPRVFDEFSTQRVLTMDWIEGKHIDQYLAGKPGQQERDRTGTLITRAGFRLCYGAKMVYADIHPGNYLFMPDGRVGLIDFGCVRHYTPEDIDFVRQSEQAAFVSRDAVRQAVIRGANLTVKQLQEEDRIEWMVRWYDWICEPVLTTEPFDFGDATYMQRGMAIWRELMVRRYVRALPVNTWLTKCFVGLRAYLLRLGARVAEGQIMREETDVPLPEGPTPGNGEEE